MTIKNEVTRRPRRLARRAILVGLVGVLAALLVPCTASASFEWLGAKQGEFPNEATEVKLSNTPAGLAVDERSGDLYEADKADRRVLRFTAAGKFIEAWGWGVGDGKDELERCGPGAGTTYVECRGFEDDERGLEGEGAGELSEPHAVAVDQSTGMVFVLTGGRLSNIVQEFTEAGEYVTGFADFGSATSDEIENPSRFGLAVDSSGNVYIGDRGPTFGPRIVEFNQTAPGVYTYDRELLHGVMNLPEYVSVDQAGDFVVASGSEIAKFTSADLTSPAWKVRPNNVEGVTVDPTSGDVYYYNPGAERFEVISPAGTEEPALSFAPAAGQTEAGGAAFDAAMALEGRAPGVLYADQPLFESSQARGFVFAQSANSPPEVSDERAADVGAGSVILAGEVNPENSPTHYRFEYGAAGPCAVDTCVEAPAGGATAPASTTGEEVSVVVGDLAPETLYHYRLVAENEFGEVAGADETFTTLPVATGLPDGRGYELVSPADKHGGEVFPLDAHLGSCQECEPGRNATRMPQEAAGDGESVVFEGLPFASTGDAVDENEYVARRTSGGWVTTDLTPEEGTTGEGTGFRAFSAGLGAGLFAQREPALSQDAPGGLEDLYLGAPGAPFVPLVTQPPIDGPERPSLVYAGSSPDLSHVVFEADAALTGATGDAPQAPTVEPGQEDLYEWSGGEVRLVNVMPENRSAAPGAVLGAGKELEGPLIESAPDRCGAVSSDGSRIFWSRLSTGRVYVRESAEATVRVNDSGKFLCASSDGTRLLLNDGHLYGLEAVGFEPTLIADLTQKQHGFEGMLGASQDLSEIYFVDTAVLKSQAGPGGTLPTPDEDNVYLYEVETGATRFITTLAPEDDQFPPEGLLGDWQPSPSDRVAEVSPEGRYLAFQSRAPLTNFDNETNGGECLEGEPKRDNHACEEVYEYDATTGALVCASCNLTGQRPAGASEMPVVQPVGSRMAQPRSLLSDGRLYFDSFEALTANDVRPGVENVYEFEHDGQGSCAREAGCIYLVSSGHSNEDASFFSSDLTGENVFFTTRAQLVPEDIDELVDLYDAREGGGFTPATPPAGCAEEGCRADAFAAIPVAVPGSSTYTGSGNAKPTSAVSPSLVRKPPKCQKGKVRKRGRCVKVKKHKKRRRKPNGSAGDRRTSPPR